MFIRDGIIFRSDMLTSRNIINGFSTREGGVSTIDYLASLNLGKGLGDDGENVDRNREIFARAVSSGSVGAGRTVSVHQIHSCKVITLEEKDCGTGCYGKTEKECDGMVTDIPDIMPLIRTADCVPILFSGIKPDGSPVIGAAHAGWKGTIGRIAEKTVYALSELGCDVKTVKVAIGAHIHDCCYTVRDDFYEKVREAMGEDFTNRHIKTLSDGLMHANLCAMNLEILGDCGIGEEKIDISKECTACKPDVYFSHRASHGKRGVMGAGIMITRQGAK